MTFKEALNMLKPYRKRVVAITLLAVLISGIAALSPFVSRSMIDDGLLLGDVGAVARFALLLIALLIASQCIEYMQRREEIAITNDLGKAMKVRAFEHGLRLKPAHFKEHGFYRTVSDALYDVTSILMIANNSLLTIFVVVCKCLGAMVGLVILDWRLSVFIALVLPAKLWLNVIIRNRAEKRGRQLMVDNKAYNSWLSNILSGITDIKLWNMREKVSSEYGGHVQSINESSKELSLLRARSNLFVIGFEMVSMNALYILGALLISREALTFGGLIAFITFASYVLGPINIILELRVILKQIEPNAESLKRFFDMEEESYAASLPIAAEIGSIEFRDVSVSLGGRDVLTRFSLKLNRGEKVAIIGENGSGKTTLINLLLRLCDPDSGEILVNGVPISEYGVEDYRMKFSVVSQDIHLFKGTVRENIELDGNMGGSVSDACEGGGSSVGARFGGDGSAGNDFAGGSYISDSFVSDGSLCGDARLKFCTDAIEAWEDGYETEVGSEGSKLSGGERQKVALLRALCRKADVLVLDEPTSSYDKESEEAFDEFKRDGTGYGFCFIITHRKDILSAVDKVVSLDDA